MLTSPITYNNTFFGFASIIKLANSPHFADSTLDILEDPQKAVHTAAAPSFGPPAFEETPHIISLIKRMSVEVTPQVVQILDPISAKVPQTNTHLHTLHDHSAAITIPYLALLFSLDYCLFPLMTYLS